MLPGLSWAKCCKYVARQHRTGFAQRTFEIMQTMKPFSSILYDSTVLESWRILPSCTGSLVPSVTPVSRTHTRVDELLLTSLPTFLIRYLFLDLANL